MPEIFNLTPAVNPSAALDELAVCIRAEHDSARAAAQSSLEHAIAAGDLLMQMKQQLKHGQWGPWLEERCKLSDRRARACIELARYRGLIEAKMAVTADLTLEASLALIADPGASRRALRANSENDRARQRRSPINRRRDGFPVIK